MKLPVSVVHTFKDVQQNFEDLLGTLSKQFVQLAVLGVDVKLDYGIAQIDFAVAAVTQTQAVAHHLGKVPAVADAFPLFGGTVISGLLMQATAWDSSTVTYQAEWKDNVARTGTLNFCWIAIG